MKGHFAAEMTQESFMLTVPKARASIAPMTTPSFPVDALIPWQRDMVEAVSLEAQTDPAMAAMFCLGFSAFTVGRSVTVASSSGTTDALPLWIVVIAASGEGKSRTFGPLIAPLREVEDAATGQPPAAPQTPAPSVSTGPTYWDRLRDDDPFDASTSTRASAADDAGWASLDLVVPQIQREQERQFPGVPLRFVHANVTPEALVEAVAGQSLGVLQAAPEAYLLNRVAASGGQAVESLANYNSMWSAEPIPMARVGRAASSPVRPVLSIVVSPQPTALEELRRGARGRLVETTGFLLRCLFCRPDSNVGRQRPRSPSVPDDVRRRYGENLRAMLSVGATQGGRPRSLRPMTYARWDAFYEDVERRRAQGADLHGIGAWAARVRQSTARLAAVLHVAKLAGPLRDELLQIPMDDDTMERAVTIGQWWIEHGMDVLLNREDAPRRDAPTSLLQVIRSVVAAQGSWEGMAAELLATLNRAAPGRTDAGWPTAANQLTRLLREADLASVGLRLDDRRTRDGSRLRLTLVDPP